MKQTLSKTGRTTRMMEEALATKADGDGREVIVIVKDSSQKEWMEANFPAAATAGVRIERISDHPHFDWRRLTIPGAHEKFAFFVDHYVIENRFEAMLEMLHRFDPPTIEEEMAREEEEAHQEKIARVEATCLPTGSRGRPQNKEEADEALERLRKAPTKLRAWDMAADRAETDAPDGVPTKVATVDKSQKPPVGWTCTRPAGHDGPCAAVPTSVPEQELIKAKMPPDMISKLKSPAGMVSSAEDDFRHSSIRPATNPQPDSEEPPRPQNEGRTIDLGKLKLPRNKNAKPKGPHGKPKK